MEDKKKNKTDGKVFEYRVALHNDFTEPYSYGEDLDKTVRHKSYDEYVAHDFDIFCKALDDFLDAPKKKLSVEDIRKDFDYDGSAKCFVKRRLSDKKVEVIRAYYNGRFDLSKTIHSKLKALDFSKIDAGCSVTMKFQIPFHLNYFTCEDNDPYDAAVKMNDAFIFIEIAAKERS